MEYDAVHLRYLINTDANLNILFHMSPSEAEDKGWHRLHVLKARCIIVHKEIAKTLTSTLHGHPVFQEYISKNLAIKYKQMNGTHTSN